MTMDSTEQMRIAIERARDREDLARRAVEIVAAESFCTGGASLTYWDHQAGAFRPGATTVGGPDAAGVARRLRRSHGASRWIIDHGRELAVADSKQDAFGSNTLLDDGGIRAYVGVPLLAANAPEPFGLLYAKRIEPGEFSADTVQAMRVLGFVIGDACRRLPHAAPRALRILVLDDDPRMRDSLEMVLGTFPDVDVQTVGTSKEAAAIVATRPDMLLFDVDLIGDTGPDLYRRLRREWTDYRPQVWFITGRKINVDPQRDRELGVNGTLLKPFGRAELLGLVERARESVSNRA